MSDCFHCGLPIKREAFAVLVDEVARETCCRGCQAVAQTIVESGLTSYYRTRSSLPATPAEGRAALERLGLYDLPDVQRSFVTIGEAGTREAALLLDGITCAACVWLIEKRLTRIAGVRAVSVNYAARRARVSWNETDVQLSTILCEIEALGYHAEPYDARRADFALDAERRALLWRLFVAGFGMMQVMMYAVPVYMADGAMTPDIEQLMRLAGLVLTAPVVGWAATPFYRGALGDLRRRKLGMDTPIAIAILVTFLASAAATFTASGDVYFDSVTMFVFLLLGARYLELGARIRASDAQARLAKLVPATAERLDRFPDPQRSEAVATAVLRPGDIVLVKPGAVVPADAIVLEGRSATDESLLTGESRSVWKAPGDRLIGGALNKHSPLVARVERVGEESLLAGIVRLMDRAQTQKPQIAIAADRAAAVFVAMVVLLSIAAAVGWSLVEPSRALAVTIAILVVSCPCALSLATPAALTAATGALYTRGVLVTRGHALETLARATHFVFDKTGTLTSGELTLVGVLPLRDVSRDVALAIAAAIEARSEHPIARAIAAVAKDLERPTAEGHLSVAGKGAEARVQGVRVRIGTPSYVGALHGAKRPALLDLVSDEVTVVALADERGWIALLTFADTLRAGARRLVASLKAQGKTVCLLSGDREARARRLAFDLDIAEVRADASPEDKVRFVRSLQDAGAVVAMIGDGVNDAPVLAQAQVSVAPGSGADLAQTEADLVLMDPNLARFAEAIALARLTMRIVRQNLAWAMLYNAVALPLAALGLVTPLLAAVGMSASSLLVVGNALRLLPQNRAGSEAPASATLATAE